MRSFYRMVSPALFLLALAASPARAVDPEAVRRAIDRGVTAIRQQQEADGVWKYNARWWVGSDEDKALGATSLAALALLECGVPAKDEAIQKAAAYVRRGSVQLTYTYSLSLAILFLDRLGEPGDVPFIESMTVRLMAGQQGGGWNYSCPPLSAGEEKRMLEVLRQQTELVGRNKAPVANRDGKRADRTLPPEIRRQLDALKHRPILKDQFLDNTPRSAVPDHSNTQFALLALWVARRHGLPVKESVEWAEKRFRVLANADGGWGYGRTKAGKKTEFAMTCAGVMVLAIAHGERIEGAKGKLAADVKKDRHLHAGLRSLARVLRPPSTLKPTDRRRWTARAIIPAEYSLWSLERTAVAVGLDTIGGKDWYDWGAEILLDAQRADGTWREDLSLGIPLTNTCFALLFLRRANLTRDLTAHLQDKVKDFGGAALKSGGLDGEALAGGAKKELEAVPKREQSAPPDEHTAEVKRRVGELVEAPTGKREKLLEELRDGKGATYTEVLAGAVPRFTGEVRDKVRQTLVERLARLKATSLARYLKDEDVEIRRASALACAAKDCKDLIPDLIRTLGDPVPEVAHAAHIALKQLSGKDLEGKPSVWQSWWDEQQRR